MIRALLAARSADVAVVAEESSPRARGAEDGYALPAEDAEFDPLLNQDSVDAAAALLQHDDDGVLTPELRSENVWEPVDQAAGEVAEWIERFDARTERKYWWNTM